MNLIQKNALRLMRKVYLKYFLKHTNNINGDGSLMSSIDANELIYQGIMSDAPFMVARFGALEMSSMANYLAVKHKNISSYWNYITRKSEAFWWDEGLMHNMTLNAGFFPNEIPFFERFAELMFEEAKYVDVLGSWLWQEDMLSAELQDAQKVAFSDLEPYHHTNPWSRALEGKRILVVHPFVESIESQYYTNRKSIFDNASTLPLFELQTLKALVTTDKQRAGFSSWFDALDYLKAEIVQRDFDIAILGCGSYGFPLAAHIKRLGKKAVHLGGATQLLFGIIGKRWLESKDHKRVACMVNNYWIRPSVKETPVFAGAIEKGAYW